jgi:glycosyltransferase involved in cell wall biosynthesis
MGMGGVQRALKFAKYLPFFGWQPIVLTVKEVNYFAKDCTLLEELPSDTKIIRTGSLDPLRLSYLLNKNKSFKGETYTTKKAQIQSWIFFPDNKIGWIPFALSKGLKICKQEKVDLIFSTSPPPTAHLAGYLLKKLTGKPWVADFRDEWIGYSYQLLPTALHRRIKQSTMRMIIKNCDSIITVNQQIAELIKKEIFDPKIIEVIPNGFDQSDFKMEVPRKTEKFTITYAGTFSLDNDPRPFFEALSNLFVKNKISPNEMKLVIVGFPLGIDLNGLIAKYKLQECAENFGYLSHPEAIQKLVESDVLLFVVSDHPESKIFTPGKLFEYLATQKPILAILPRHNPAAEIINSIGAGEIIEPHQIEQIENKILYIYGRYRESKQEFKYNFQEISQFERKHLTSKLATLFERITQKLC